MSAVGRAEWGREALKVLQKIVRMFKKLFNLN